MTFSEKNCNTCGQRCAIKYHGCSNWIPISDGELLIPISALDKIRAEITEERKVENIPEDVEMWDYIRALDRTLSIVDKYRAEQGASE